MDARDGGEDPCPRSVATPRSREKGRRRRVSVGSPPDLVRVSRRQETTISARKGCSGRAQAARHVRSVVVDAYKLAPAGVSSWLRRCRPIGSAGGAYSLPGRRVHARVGRLRARARAVHATARRPSPTSFLPTTHRPWAQLPCCTLARKQGCASSRPTVSRWTSNRSATRPDSSHPVHRHDLGRARAPDRKALGHHRYRNEACCFDLGCR
jgi:hypothetical protein